MKASVLLVSILGLSLAGCGGPLWKESKETIVEKPVASQPAPEIVVQQTPPREVIVEKPVVIPRNCAVGSTFFTHGSSSCQSGFLYRCNDGNWETRGALC